ncbi:Bug family tripartite tricarboxylate transporter substrate binding protein [Humitalea sp. 24SJ18S-53]|uniref:Bug family tripartite tricarboxylate transporter substrate binding protein n=1 Tax=Humitalea sp. 24SJ18S-53 TaxID=3422307 RepID=UPI003D668A7F
MIHSNQTTLGRRAILGAAAMALAAPALAQTATAWPDRPITLVVPFLAGGSTDIAARILADRMPPLLGPRARIIVENRAGAGGSVGADFARRQAPDGYTLLLGTASSHGTNPVTLQDTTRYDPITDFTPIALVGGGPLVVVVPRNSPFRTIEDLVADMRARPNALHWGTSGTGNIGHLTGAMVLASAPGGGAPLEAEHVSYRGGSQVMEAMAKGELNFSLEPMASAAPHLRDDVSRGLAVTSRERSPLFPDMPSLLERGFVDFDSTTWNVLVGPRGMPPEITAALNRATLTVLADPAVRSRLSIAGVDAAPPMTPDQTRDFLVAELAKFRAIVARGGLTFN